MCGKSMFKASGTSLSADRFTILAINGINPDVHFFNSKAGIGSNIQDLDGHFKTIFLVHQQTLV